MATRETWNRPAHIGIILDGNRRWAELADCHYMPAMSMASPALELVESFAQSWAWRS